EVFVAGEGDLPAVEGRDPHRVVGHTVVGDTAELLDGRRVGHVGDDHAGAPIVEVGAAGLDEQIVDERARVGGDVGQDELAEILGRGRIAEIDDGEPGDVEVRQVAGGANQGEGVDVVHVARVRRQRRVRRVGDVPDDDAVRGRRDERVVLVADV